MLDTLNPDTGGVTINRGVSLQSPILAIPPKRIQLWRGWNRRGSNVLSPMSTPLL